MPRAMMVLAGLVLAAGLALAGEEDKGDKCPGGGAKRDAGLVAHYFKDPTEWDGNWKEGEKPTVDPLNWTFKEYRYSRIEPLVNHLFIRRGWFSIRWVGDINLEPACSPKDGKEPKVKGVVVPPEGVEVKFELWMDDGARLFIDGQKLIDDWRHCPEDSPEAHRTAAVKLTPGPHKIVIEYFQGESLKHDDKDPAKAYWSCEALGLKRQVIPASHFSHTEADLQDYVPSTLPEGGEPPAADVNVVNGPDNTNKGGKGKKDDQGGQ